MLETTPADYETAAPKETMDAVANRLRERNVEAVIVATGADAKAAIFDRLPEGAEVHSSKSRTLEDIGVFKELMESGRYDFIRTRTYAMDRQTQAREIRKLGAAPDYMLGSAQALTEAGQIVVASASGLQIGPYAMGAEKLILVVGSQKIVPDLDAAFGRIRDHVQPYEDARLREQYGIGTTLAQVLIMERVFGPAGRITVILVREPVGV
ncbi:MAG: LUD domain-containing protein [Candidatus Limnocylindrales bacterium]